MGPPSYMRSIVDRNVVMRRMTVLSKIKLKNFTQIFLSSVLWRCVVLEVHAIIF